jgi:metal-responsive CopG/Arc/MetJ family transcriptional regulator
MDEEKTKLNFEVDRELLSRINDFRFKNRIDSKSEAIRRLIDEALRQYESTKPPVKKK